MIPYEEIKQEKVNLPPRNKEEGYIRPPFTDQTFVPEIY